MRKAETVARMLAADNALGVTNWEDYDGRAVGEDWRDWEDDYQTVLLGIREPTREQLDAGQRKIMAMSFGWTGGRPKSNQLRALAAEIWRTMIDELRNEKRDPDHGQSVERRAAEALFETTAD